MDNIGLCELCSLPIPCNQCLGLLQVKQKKIKIQPPTTTSERKSVRQMVKQWKIKFQKEGL